MTPALYWVFWAILLVTWYVLRFINRKCKHDWVVAVKFSGERERHCFKCFRKEEEIKIWKKKNV